MCALAAGGGAQRRALEQRLAQAQRPLSCGGTAYVLPEDPHESPEAPSESSTGSSFLPRRSLGAMGTWLLVKHQSLRPRRSRSGASRQFLGARKTAAGAVRSCSCPRKHPLAEQPERPCE